MMKIIIPAVCLLMLFNIPAGYHPVFLEAELHPPAVTLRAYYTRTLVVADGEITIVSPLEKLYQKGRTDLRGCFAFIPDLPGRWTIEIDDKMGHLKRIILDIPAGFFEMAVTPDVVLMKDSDEIPAQEKLFISNLPLLYRIIPGLALIMGITGLLYALKAKREMNKSNRS